MNENLEGIKDRHQTGIKGILFLYGIKRLKKSLPFKIAFIITTASVLIFSLLKVDILNSLKIITELNNTIFPCLLGFTIAGYALVVAFSTNANLQEYTDTAPKENGSFFQMLTAIFSISIFTQLITLILSYVVNFILNVVYFKMNCYCLNVFFGSINWITFYIISLFSLWAFFTIPYIVTNLFNLAQTAHIISLVEKMNKNDDNKDD